MKIKLSPRELKPGIIALEAIVTPSGQILAPAGTELTRQTINKMKLYNVDSATVDSNDPIVKQMLNASSEAATSSTPVEAPAAPVAPEPEAPKEEEKIITHVEETRSTARRMLASSEFKGFQLDYFMYIEYAKEVFANIVNTPGYSINTTELIEKMRPLYASRNTIVELFDMIQQMHSLSDTVYAHCLNVALISRMIGRWLHLEQNDLNILTCCGLLHDIGKLTIPEEVLNKPGKLTDEEFALIKSHPKTGYEMLRNKDIDTRIKQAALMHHERYDGSGYPNQLSSEFLSDFAMIVAIADVYDAMTAARSYREPLCPFQVIEKFEQEGFQKYHTKYIYVFLHHIASTYQSNRVMLSDGRGCKIVMLNQNTLSKPIVQFDDGSCVDLSSQRELYITKVLQNLLPRRSYKSSSFIFFENIRNEPCYMKNYTFSGRRYLISGDVSRREFSNATSPLRAKACVNLSYNKAHFVVFMKL